MARDCDRCECRNSDLTFGTEDPANDAPSFSRVTDEAEEICACGFEFAADVAVFCAELALGAVCGRCDATLDCKVDVNKGGCTAAGASSTDEDDTAVSEVEAAAAAAAGRAEARDADDDRLADAVCNTLSDDTVAGV